MDPQITVAGLPATVGINGYGFYAIVAFQTVFIHDSPLVVNLTPPVATIAEVGTPALLGLIGALAGGAVIITP